MYKTTLLNPRHDLEWFLYSPCYLEVLDKKLSVLISPPDDLLELQKSSVSFREVTVHILFTGCCFLKRQSVTPVSETNRTCLVSAQSHLL